MKIAIFGCGFVGSALADYFGEQGHWLYLVDPIKYPGTDALAAIRESEIIFICVGTPSLPSGAIDLSQIKAVSEEIGSALKRVCNFKTIVVKSTVLPGTCENLIIPTIERLSGKHKGKEFTVCANPEFLRQNHAAKDIRHPEITVIGAAESEHAEPLYRLYRHVPGRTFVTNLKTAETIKYVCNTWHALKVAFANEVARLSESLGIIPGEICLMFLADKKLNVSDAYLFPGGSFGGACLPKDVSALATVAYDLGSFPILEAILPSNAEHHRFTQTMANRVAPDNRAPEGDLQVQLGRGLPAGGDACSATTTSL